MPAFRLNLLYEAAALFAAALLYGQLHPALAQPQPPAHYNAAEIQRESPTSVQFAFALNLPQALHQVLAPQLSYPAFLQRYGDLPEPALDKEMAQAAASLSAKAYFTLPSGAKAPVKQWQLPDAQAVRDSLKASLMLLNMPPGPASHLDPVRVLARVQAKTPITRVQLQLPPALYPIVVSLPNDKFWLTAQIPMAIVDLP